MNLRKVEVSDLVKLPLCNIYNMPENYYMRVWEYMIVSWPELSFLAEDERGKVVGYVLSSIEPDGSRPCTRIGHINSLSVLRPYRRLGIAQKLMNLSKEAMLRENDPIEFIQLHVRRSNKAARSLYDKLGYECHHVEAKYYSNGEDAFVMRFSISSKNPENPENPEQQKNSYLRKTWISNLWHFVHNRPHRFAEAAMSLLRRRSSHP